MSTIINYLTKIVLISFVSLLISSTRAAQVSRIVNGNIVDISQIPYILQLKVLQGDYVYFYCGASLITPRHALTAAHCFDAVSYKDMAVVGAANTRSDAGVERKIIELIKHPQYRSEKLSMDVAVLKLDRPLTGRNIQTVRLCTKPWQEDEVLKVFGWGRLNSGGLVSNELRTVELSMISHEKCKANHGSDLSSEMECTYSSNKDFCKGDSGGPGIYKGELCGVVIWNRGCANNAFAGVYTSVYAVRDFIDRATRK